MLTKELIGYAVQLGAVIAVLVGVYFAFDHARIFFPLAGGLIAWFVGKFIRREF